MESQSKRIMDLLNDAFEQRPPMAPAPVSAEKSHEKKAAKNAVAAATVGKHKKSKKALDKFLTSPAASQPSFEETSPFTPENITTKESNKELGSPVPYYKYALMELSDDPAKFAKVGAIFGFHTTHKKIV